MPLSSEPERRQSSYATGSLRADEGISDAQIEALSLISGACFRRKTDKEWLRTLLYDPYVYAIVADMSDDEDGQSIEPAVVDTATYKALATPPDLDITLTPDVPRRRVMGLLLSRIKQVRARINGVSRRLPFAKMIEMCASETDPVLQMEVTDVLVQQWKVQCELHQWAGLLVDVPEDNEARNLYYMNNDFERKGKNNWSGNIPLVWYGKPGIKIG